MTGQVLFAGGSGDVGRHAVRWFRERHPSVPVLVGGRDLQAASEVAQEAGAAEAVSIDLDKPRLGLDDDVAVAAVVMLAPDNGLTGLRLAQDLGVPFLNINNGLVEVGPEVALFAYRATAAPIVLASHWAGGAAVFLALKSAEAFQTVRSITVAAVLDEKDQSGPASSEDMERLGQAAATLGFEGGRRVWLTGDSARSEVETVDGRLVDAEAFSPFDIISLYAATGASDIRFDLATAESSSRRRGDEVAAEIVVDIEGEANGATKRSRATLEFKYGQSSLTALCVVLSLSAALGLSDGSAAPPGLYLPELLADSEWFLDELRSAGAVIQDRSG